MPTVTFNTHFAAIALFLVFATGIQRGAISTLDRVYTPISRSIGDAMSEVNSTAAPSLNSDHAERISALAKVFGEEYANNFTDPVMFIRKSFSSPGVNHQYSREFDFISRTLFLEMVYRRRPLYNQEVLDAFSNLMSKKIADVLTLLNTQSERILAICKSHELTHERMEEATYMHPKQILIPIISNHAKSYISVLEKLDQIYVQTGSAILNGAIDGNQRKKFELLCRQAVRAFSAMLRHESIKLRKESQRMRAAQNASPDDEVSLAEAVHDRSQSELDKAHKADAAAGDPSVIAPQDGAQVLDNLVATTNATAKRAAKTPKPEVATANAATNA